MTSTPLDLPILISQLPNLQQTMGPQHVPHDAQQVLFGQLVADNQRKDEQKVQTVEKKEDGPDAMGREAGGNKNAQQHLARQRRTPPPEPEQQPGTQSSNASPWAGNIINVKI